MTQISRTGNSAVGGGTNDAYKNAINTLARQQANNVPGMGIIDVAEDPNLGADGAYSNTTYFGSDAVHPTTAGDTLFGAAVTRGVLQYTGNTAASPNSQAAAYTMTAADRFLSAPITAATTDTFPDCIALSLPYTINNTSTGGFVLTLAGQNSEAISGSATITAGVTGVFQPQPVSASAGGCIWLRTQ